MHSRPNARFTQKGRSLLEIQHLEHDRNHTQLAQELDQPTQCLPLAGAVSLRQSSLSGGRSVC